MTAPTWIESVVREFGKAAGLAGLALNTRGAAAITFENGAALRLEYAFDSLVVALTLPALNSVFSILWRIGQEFGGAA